MKKLLVVGIIILFIGVGFTSGIGVNDKTSNESSFIVSENEDSTNAPDEIYENTDCDVIGFSMETSTWSYVTPWEGPVMYEGDIAFGYEIIYLHEHWANGWIITNGNSSKWAYRGFFQGYGLGKYYSWDPFYHGEEREHFIGIKGFKGYAFGGGNLFMICFYIGHADTVRIIT